MLRSGPDDVVFSSDDPLVDVLDLAENSGVIELDDSLSGLYQSPFRRQIGDLHFLGG